MNIKLTKSQKIKLLNTDDVFKVMQNILKRENKIDRNKEHFWVIGLNVVNKILFIELVSLGGVKAATVEPMNVFRMAVQKGAVKLIMVHNHPGGEVKPSLNDKDLTDRLIQVGKILDVHVIDHLVITENSFLSFADTGLLVELMGSTKWVPSYELENRIRAEEEKIRKEAVKTAREKGKKEGLKEGEKNKTIAIAKAMLSRGMSMEEVVDILGLPGKEVENLALESRVPNRIEVINLKQTSD